MIRHKGISASALLVMACASIMLTACESKDAVDREPAASSAAGEPGESDANATAAAADRAVVAETLPYAEVGDELVYGHFVFPADMIDPLPAVIVIHEWWGLNDTVRTMADRLAAEGYIVLAVDLFAGQTADNAPSARELMLEVLENAEGANENLRQAYDWLQSTAGAPRIGALGWGFGGGWALNTALMYPDDLDAAVVYYGQVMNDIDRLMPLSVPVLGIFAADDRIVPVETVRAFEGVLEDLGKTYEIEVFSDAESGFANPAGNNYAPEIAAEAWSRTTGFLRTHMKPDDQ